MTSLVAVLAAGCGPDERSGEACSQLRGRFDAAFKDAISATAREAPDERKTALRASQEAFLAMERRGCCLKENVCPVLNVH